MSSHGMENEKSTQNQSHPQIAEPASLELSAINFKVNRIFNKTA